jgi:HlyD family secretion protein
VSSPVAGRVLRIELEPGDAVKRGQVVARIRAETPPLLDERTRAEGQAAIDSARAALGRARADEQRGRATLAHLPARGDARARARAGRRAVDSRARSPRDEAKVAGESVNAAVFRRPGSDLGVAARAGTPRTVQPRGGGPLS